MRDDNTTSTTSATDEDGTNGGDVQEDDGTDDNGADDGKDVDDADAHLSMRKVVAMMLTRLKRKSARAEVQETCLTDHARAAVRACAPRGISCKGFVPWAHDRSIAGAPRGEDEIAGFARIHNIPMVFV